MHEERGEVEEEEEERGEKRKGDEVARNRRWRQPCVVGEGRKKW